MPIPSKQFASLLKELITEYQRQHPVNNAPCSLQMVAKRLGYQDGSGLSRWLRGERLPKDKDIILNIARGLELDAMQRDALLVAADHQPAKPLDLLEPAALLKLHELLNTTSPLLQEPDRQLFSDQIRSDIAALFAAWATYFDVRRALYRRQWRTVSQRSTDEVRQRSVNQPLANMGARINAHIELLQAAGEFHRGDLDRATQHVQNAIKFAEEYGGDPVVQCRADTRQADIFKLQSLFEQAEERYRLAFKQAQDIAAAEPSLVAWARHWEGRIQRKWATLYLFRGMSATALTHLTVAIAIFNPEEGSQYELAQTYYAKGWCHSNLGEWEEAREAHKQGLEIARTRTEQGWNDWRQELEGELSLANDEWYLERLDDAERHLARAAEILKQHRSPNQPGGTYNDLGRYDLLRARVIADRAWSSVDHTAQAMLLEQARAILREAIDNEDRPMPTPSRLSSLLNALGYIELRAGRYPQAIGHFDEGIRWSIPDLCRPANEYYHSYALAFKLEASLWNGDTLSSLAPTVDAALEAARTGPYWQQLARIERILAIHAIAAGPTDSVPYHVARCLRFAARFNSALSERSISSIQSTLMDAMPGSMAAVWHQVLPQLRALEDEDFLDMDRDPDRRARRRANLLRLQQRIQDEYLHPERVSRGE